MILQEERNYGLQELRVYLKFQPLADKMKDSLVSFLIEQKRNGKIVVAYGAAAKGNTILNYAGVKPDLLPFVCDASKEKQGKFMPGSHLPIVSPERLWETNPDYVLILPWNIASEVKEQLRDLAQKEDTFLTTVPDLLT